MTRVVFVDDHTLVRQSLAKVVSATAGIEVVGETGRGDEAVELVTRLRPDLLVLDINIPGMDGFQVAQAVRARFPDIKLVFVTMHEDDAHIRQALRVGADGYVPKTSSAEEVIQALTAVAAGGSYLSPAVARRVIGFSSRGTSLAGDLTERELEILRLLSQGANVREVAERTFLSVKTIKNHLTNIYAKLGVNGAAQAVAAAYRLGLVSSLGEGPSAGS